MTYRCRHCGWPESEPYRTLSRHVTSRGTIVYEQCRCGINQVRLEAPDHDRMLARVGRPTS